MIRIASVLIRSRHYVVASPFFTLVTENGKVTLACFRLDPSMRGLWVRTS